MMGMSGMRDSPHPGPEVVHKKRGQQMYWPRRFKERVTQADAEKMVSLTLSRDDYYPNLSRPCQARRRNSGRLALRHGVAAIDPGFSRA